MSDPFVAQLADLCKAHVTRAKWVFVPSHGVGRTIGERIALAGTNWLNLRFVTPLDVALRMGAPFLVERGIDPSEEGLGPALIMRLLLDLPLEGGYFRPLADQPTMAQALYATVRELRMAGVKAKDIKAEAFESAAKHAEMCALLGAYEQFLETNHRGDMATVYEEAMQHPDWCPIQSEDCWTELPDTLWTPLQRTLIDALPGERIVPRVLEIPGATQIPRRLADQAVDRLTPDPATTPLSFLLKPAVRGQEPPSAATIELFHAGGREAEVEEVFRRILAAGASLDQVEIACASQGYDTLIWEKALRLELPVTLGTGLPIEFTRPGRALLGFCEWIEGDFVASTLRRLLESGDIRFNDVEDLKPAQAARLLVKAKAGWGRGTYGLSLGKLRRGYELAAQNPDLSVEIQDSSRLKATRTGLLLDWITSVLLSIPGGADGGNVKLSDAVSAALGFLDSAASTASAVDNLAASSLREAVGDLRSLGTFSCSLATALRFIRERAEGLTVGADRARPGHLHVSSIRQFGYAGRPIAFVVGVEEGRVFPSAVEDPVLLDAERAAISVALQRSTDRIDEAVGSVLSRLATSRGTVTLSHSCRDLREYRETFPSWLVLQAFRIRSDNATLSYPDLARALGPPVSIVPLEPAAALSEAGWWMSQLKSSGSKGQTHVLAQFPPLARGMHAEAHRASDAFTEFDGHVPAAGKVLDPVQVGRTVSATQLESAADCAYRHFLQRGLGVSPIDEREKDADTWLDPGTRGSELHDLYAAMLRRNRKAAVPLKAKRDLPWLLGRGKARLEELRVEMPPPSDEVFERECRDVLADLELFLLEECEREPTRIPVGLEVSFGRAFNEDEDGEPEPLAQEEPVVVDLGEGVTFKLAGRIDRIDQVGDETFEIIDYKTGGYYAKKWASGVFNGGSRLQHALYGIAAGQLLRKKYKGAKVARAIYYFSSVKGGKERRVIETPSKAVLAAVLADLRAVIASGTFIHAADEEACMFCDLGAACGAADALARVETKSLDQLLAARRRLQNRE
ncbi:MAG TPA: PD-(D/E)XK nuclease family protein [Vicinamibacterales bacterium]|nr:PD-(D/E)XK nuclease family protein [Vicinamibacterales bacterium]